jgi:hypothetical protein
MLHEMGGETLDRRHPTTPTSIHAQTVAAMTLIGTYLKSCRELSRFCSQNGWIDGDSLRFTIIMEIGNEVIVDIEFEELLMVNSGDLVSRVTCRGQMHLFTDQYGHVIRSEAL